MRPIQSPRLAALNADAFLEDDVTDTTVDLAAHRGESSLEDLALDDDYDEPVVGGGVIGWAASRSQRARSGRCLPACAEWLSRALETSSANQRFRRGSCASPPLRHAIAQAMLAAPTSPAGGRRVCLCALRARLTAWRSCISSPARVFGALFWSPPIRQIAGAVSPMGDRSSKTSRRWLGAAGVDQESVNRRSGMPASAAPWSMRWGSSRCWTVRPRRSESNAAAISSARDRSPRRSH